MDRLTLLKKILSVERLKNTFKKVDAFGERLDFNVNGRSRFNTGLGSIVTILIYALVLIYAQQKATKVLLRADTSHQTSINVDVIPRD